MRITENAHVTTKPKPHHFHYRNKSGVESGVNT